MNQTFETLILKHVQQAAEDIMNEEVEKAIVMANEKVRQRMAQIVAGTTLQIMERVTCEYHGREFRIIVELPKEQNDKPRT